MDNQFVKLTSTFWLPLQCNKKVFGIVVSKYSNMLKPTIQIKVLQSEESAISIGEIIITNGYEYDFVTDQETVDRLSKLMVFQ